MAVKEKISPQKEEHLKEVEKQKRIERRLLREARQFRQQFAKQAFQLVTSGFGLVAALAWNELIKEAVSLYVKPYFGESSGLISLAIYALIVTFLAVFITYQLSKFAEKEE
jgi:sterol desaturase/sphingolipid hydroxylase (fatty acid hydroxylase superfamily)